MKFVLTQEWDDFWSLMTASRPYYSQVLLLELSLLQAGLSYEGLIPALKHPSTYIA